MARAPYIKVPDEWVRSREAVLQWATLAKADDGVEYAWVPCHNCGGTGHYPSSCIPPGKCRLYCWLGRDAATFGKLPVAVDVYVKRAQASDRAAYRAQVRAQQAAVARAGRLANVDSRIAMLCSTWGWVLAALPDSAPTGYAGTALSLAQQWLTKGTLSEAQWALVAKLQVWQQEHAAKELARSMARAASKHVGTVGERLRALACTLVHVAEYEGQGYQGGTRYRYTLRTAGGDKLVYWTSSHVRGLGHPLALPMAVVLTATVKRHVAYQGEAQTEVQRARVVPQVAVGSGADEGSCA